MCDDCRKKLSKVPLPTPESAEAFESSQDDGSANSDPEELSYQQESTEPVNQCLSAIVETPI